MGTKQILVTSAISVGDSPTTPDLANISEIGPHRHFNKARCPRAARRNLRVALYSHDTMGIGHMRRNLLIAETLMRCRGLAGGLIVAGAREAAALVMPAGVDCLTLPAFRKHRGGGYRSRSLGMPLEDLVFLRARTIRAAIEAYQPDVFIVDKVPRGHGGELELTLETLRRRGRTRCVLGLRDVLDSPSRVRCEWHQDASDEAVENYYDTVWVYGDPAVYDPVREYGFSAETAAKIRYTGYFDQRIRLRWAGLQPENPPAGLGLAPGPLTLCMVGGGQDGASLAQAFAKAALTSGMNAVLLTGPCMPLKIRQRLQRLAAGAPQLRVLEFVAEPSPLLAAAERVVAMGGYNTVTEILSFGKRALIVPRTVPREEQLIRAERLRDLGLIDVLHPDQLTSEAITRWLTSDFEPLPPARERIDFQGLTRLPEFLAELVQTGG